MKYRAAGGGLALLYVILAVVAFSMAPTSDERAHLIYAVKIIRVRSKSRCPVLVAHDLSGFGFLVFGFKRENQ